MLVPSLLQLRDRLRFLICPARFSLRVVLVYCYIFLGVLALLTYIMYLKHSLPTALLGLLASTQHVIARPQSTPDPYRVYTISAGNITAKLIPHGARLTSLLVPDRKGIPQDVIVGFDDPTQYSTDDNFYGPVVGRYANRIKNGTFTVADNTFHVPKNEHDGLNSLHGGDVGYDKRNWTVTAYTNSSITFSFYDHAFEGFPGDVLTHATYTVDNNNPSGSPQLTTNLVSLALTEATPIMLANHIYWNLNAFRDPNLLHDVTLQLPLSTRFIATDSILIPNGTISTVDAYNGALDFTSPKLVGADINSAVDLCGANCTGYDNCWLVDRPTGYSADAVIPALYMSSQNTGISLEVSTNMPAIQIYSCNGQDGSDPVRPSQIQRNRDAGFNGPTTVDKNTCVVVETEGWIDGINQPAWGQLGSQIFTPGGPPAVNHAVYKFWAV
ncbi:galactose mutarotase-like domain-containing protein [Aspergillus cavernicola]|uniref:Galactose mutarotase-like domain-containing protein n=1 Tax=Aspergillus cavernicola TaxID=176166 RepID=A0ABR4J530_9EURO